MSSSCVEVRSWHRPLMIMVAAMAVLVVVAGVGLVADDRLLQPPELERLRPDRLAIGQQVFQSGVIGLFGASVLIAVMLLFQRVGEPALTWALRAGIGLAALGMAVAFFIVGVATEEERIVEDAYGGAVTLSGQHGVGMPDGGGMPITNWSVVGGDLRVPHFIGLHAIQVFVLAVVVLTALAARVTWLRSERVRAQLTGVVILGYTGLFAITTWQALRGQSLVHPDAATWTAAAATLAVTVLLAAATVASARRRTTVGRHRAAAEVLSRTGVS